MSLGSFHWKRAGVAEVAIAARGARRSVVRPSAPDPREGPAMTDLSELSERDRELCAAAPARYDDLHALFVNGTLKPSPERSHTAALAERSMAIMRAVGVDVDSVRAVDLHLAPGVQPDMTAHGAERDDWPALYRRVAAADILVLLTPIWLGEKSSVITRVVERLYGNSGELNAAGQYAYYGRTAGVVVTGNEDGAKHCAMNLLYSLSHLGYVIPPQVDAAWVGEAGPGPSYADAESGGPANDFTHRNTTFMTWNLLHTARWLKDAGGFPAHGNQRSRWEAGCRFDAANPEHR